MIAEALGTGIDQAITGRKLCELLNLSPRELSQAVEKERRSGIPICASCRGDRLGYYIAIDREELSDYCNTLTGRIREITRTLNAVREAGTGLPEGRRA